MTKQSIDTHIDMNYLQKTGTFVSHFTEKFSLLSLKTVSKIEQNTNDGSTYGEYKIVFPQCISYNTKWVLISQKWCRGMSLLSKCIISLCCGV